MHMAVYVVLYNYNERVKYPQEMFTLKKLMSIQDSHTPLFSKYFLFIF